MKFENYAFENCERCGGNALLAQDNRMFFVKCSKCGFRTKPHASAEEAVIDWNSWMKRGRVDG